MAGEVKLTEKQAAAVNDRGGALLVSAAAGSGKTMVLVERLLKRITEENCDIDDFLIITYTNAAAAELKGKIIDAIGKRLALEPGNIRIHRQFERCYRAKISTIHSFCTEVIRQNAHLIDITPDFKVIDQTEADIIKSNVLDDVLEAKYDGIQEGSAFSLLADMVSSGRTDTKLANLVLEVYDKMQMSPDPEKWAMEQKKRLSLQGVSDIAQTVWGKEIIKRASSSVKYWREKMRAVLDDMESDPELEKRYGKSLKATFNGIENLYNAMDGTWDEIRALSQVEFPRPGNISGREEIKRVRKACSTDLGKVSKLFSASSQDLIEDIRSVEPVMDELIDTAAQFANAYSLEKRRRGVIDFSDQEHLALKILTDKEGRPTEEATAIAQSLTEIMVDEYQDVNEIQETIFTAISRNGSNVFMVGDVKQSIYRFRLAEPGIFIDKYNRLKDSKDAKDGEGRKIVLSTNFRSRAGVLQAVNFIFENIMSSSLGEIDYTEEEHLYPGVDYPENGQSEMEVCIVNCKDMEAEDDERPEKTELEAQAIAGRIKELCGEMELSDGAGGLRKAAWGDFTILLRSMKNKASIYAGVLERNGIPVSVDKSEEFFQSSEIISVMSLLAVIDNPHQDIPLISALRSFLFGFTADDLANIRTFDKQSDFYDALCASAETVKKAKDFLELLDYFRHRAPEVPADVLLWEVYMKTQAIAIVGAMPEGRQRQENLMTLFEIAQKYESEGYKGLFGFVIYLREIAQNGGISVQMSSAGEDNAVKIMSIHKSKGLEYPVVILADTAKRFNKSDGQVQLPIHKTLGFGPEITDLKRRIKYPTIAKMAVSGQIIKEKLSEEMRVLYVALTRAKEKLIVFATYTDADRKLEKYSLDLSSPLDPKMLEGAESMAQWIIMAAMLRKEGSVLIQSGGWSPKAEDGFLWDIRRVNSLPDSQDEVEEMSGGEVISDLDREETDSDKNSSDFEERLNFVYSHEDAQTMPSKLTATELKGRFLDQEAGEEAEFFKPGKIKPLQRPDFEREMKPLTGAERGTALHIVMQFIDYKKCLTAEDIDSEVQRLKDMHIISEKQAEAVDKRKILELFMSETGKMILNAESIKREFKFSLLVPANTFYDGGNDDEILLQGVIDCLLENGGELTIIDYKTDRVSGKTIETTAQYYKGQVEVYSMAMERITGKRVSRCGLYFFSVGKVVWL